MAAPSRGKITEEFLKKTTGEYDLEMVQRLELSYIGLRYIENLSSCTNVRTLQLRGNEIRDIRGLDRLLFLERLDLSCNKIRQIGNLGHLASLQSLDLKGNEISNVDDIRSLCPLPNLRRFFMQDYQGNEGNPACQHPSYHAVVTRLLPRLDVLDGESLNLRKCMVDVMLDNTKADDIALISPEPQRWCNGFDWTPDGVGAAIEEDSRIAMDEFRDTLQECAQLNQRARDALHAIE